MTVLPFAHPRRERADAAAAGSLPAASAAPELRGTFLPPRGGSGTFTGTYRLERLVDEYGQTAAAGVVTGELMDAEGMRIGMGSRRLTAAAAIGQGADGYVAQIGPLDVNISGFLVSVEEFTVSLPHTLPSTPAGRSASADGERTGP